MGDLTGCQLGGRGSMMWSYLENEFYTEVIFHKKERKKERKKDFKNGGKTKKTEMKKKRTQKGIKRKELRL